ncbi:hypothetical protein [Niabella hibiscisoli]|uniref:hypothetical protein n=1 Tax=Niabella hibiscisoli TaxID=1825928 RepID=UPI001F10D14A|nr:hypothetical protein [Niabella hibiscisoli]MCH5718552.1 hypothetical protein [Niabella hibiscisoli]
MLALLVSATGIIIYQAKNNDGSIMPIGSSADGKQCMYWTGDHYEAVPCSRKIDDVIVIALDTVKLRRFKKITRPDTITENDIGRVWYTRINKQLEFYTAYDNHPTQPQFRLKPITGYIIDKYIQHRQSTE